MMEQDPLSQLQDIILPSTVYSWPIAWGWWCVAILLLACILVASILLIRRYRFYALKRTALKATVNISNASEANQILKIACIHYFGRERVAALHGQAWREFLLQQLPPAQRAAQQEALEKMLAALYRSSTTTDATQFAVTVSLWLKTARWTSHA